MGLRAGVGALVCLACAVALAQDDRTRAAREELDRQLKELVGKAPTRVKVTFQGLDEPGFAVEESEFTLDGRPLPSPLAYSLSREGEHLVYTGEESPGDHRLEAKVTIVDVSNAMMSREAGYKWKIGVSRTFSLQRGLEVHVALSPLRDARAPQTKDKFKLTSNATPRMLAVLDDGKMPEMVRPVQLEQVPDAGTAAAAEEKKRKAEEARAARLAAAEEKKRKAEEARAAKAAAAEEKKRLAEEKRQAALDAKAGKTAAAEEKAALNARVPPAGAGEAGAVAAGPVEPTSSDATADAGSLAEALDAGAAAVAEAPPPVRPGPAEPSGADASSDPPWLAIGVAAGVGLLALLVALARRRANPRDPGA